MLILILINVQYLQEFTSIYKYLQAVFSFKNKGSKSLLLRFPPYNTKMGGGGGGGGGAKYLIPPTP